MLCFFMKICCKKIQDKEFSYIILKTSFIENTLYIRLKYEKMVEIEACINVNKPVE